MSHRLRAAPYRRRRLGGLLPPVALLASGALLLVACGSGKTTSSPATTVAGTSPASTSPVTATSTPSSAVPTSGSVTPTTKPASSTGGTTPTSAAGAPANGLTSITVSSTADQYFVLFVKPNPTLPLEVAVSITRGKAGSTTLTDGRAQLATDRYRVATYQVSAPADVDGDGIDDLTELADPVSKNPLNAARALSASDGAVIIPDRATYEAMSYQGNDVSRDAYLAGQEFVKFWIVGANTDHAAVYFMNTNAYRAHPAFASAIGLPAGRAQGTMRGDVVWDPAAVGPSGKPGAYRFAFQENDALPFAEISVAYELLAASMPFIANDLMYFPLPQAALPLYLSKEKPLYDASRVPVLVKP